MLDQLFRPEGIAVVGASANPAKAGYVALRNMREKNYPGKVYPVNPKEKEILGYPCYPSLQAVEGHVDMVVLIMPSRLIYSTMDDLDARMEEKGDVKVIVCAAADYAETKTPEGIDRQKRLMDGAKRYGIRVVGPNCIGVIDNRSLVDTTFVDTGVPFEAFGEPTGIAFLSQSGALACSVLMEGAARVVPVLYNKFISIGNMADVDFVDLLEYLEEDETTKVIGLYMEGYHDGKKLAETFRRLTKKKPVVVLKVGRSDLGSAAANSHTGSMAGSDRVYDAMFRQSGVVRVETIDELIDTLQAFDRLPVPRGNNLFLYTQAGGPGIYCTDAIAAWPALHMPVVSEETKEKLRACELPMSNICQPEGYADITASASPKNHVDGLKVVLEDDNVDGVVFITVVPTFLPQKELAEALVAVEKSFPEGKRKPVYYCVMAGAYTKEARAIMEQNGLCTFNTPDKAVLAAKNLCRYGAYLREREA
ncbi:MAG: acetyl-CoA synthetase [Lachnospiraceae bacterium]|nr:acetyl-CoA synthetase [Lachnospiraceae bacterium]